MTASQALQWWNLLGRRVLPHLHRGGPHRAGGTTRAAPPPPVRLATPILPVPAGPLPALFAGPYHVHFRGRRTRVPVFHPRARSVAHPKSKKGRGLAKGRGMTQNELGEFLLRTALFMTLPIVTSWGIDKAKWFIRDALDIDPWDTIVDWAVERIGRGPWAEWAKWWRP